MTPRWVTTLVLAGLCSACGSSARGVIPQQALDAGPGAHDAVPATDIPSAIDSDTHALPDIEAADSLVIDAQERRDAPPAAPCANVTCSGHGTCREEAGQATCQCDADYTAAAELACINSQIVPCAPASPRDAFALPAGVEVHYTDLAGWSAPETCPWQCNGGFVRVQDRCVPLEALPRWCADHCVAQQTFCPGGGSGAADCEPACDTSLPGGTDCLGACLAALDEPSIASRVLCGGVARRVESAQCGQLGSCDEPVVTTGCDALCDAVDGCSLLANPRMLFGGSHGECVLYCQAMATALAPKGRFDIFRECALEAMNTCDPVRLLACTLDGYHQLGANLCTTNSADCGYIPNTWPDAAACEAALASWSGGQRLAVSGCMTFLGAYPLCGEHDCGNPPASAPPNVVAAVNEITAACPELFRLPFELDYVIEYYGWLLTAVLKAAGRELDVDVAAVSACIHAEPCPTFRDQTLLCVLNAPEE